MPIINIESADSRFASAYLSFSSDILEQNEITDFLVRVVQPRLSAIQGVQRADILGARTFAMRIWLKPDRMGALNISPAQVRQALAANNFLAALGRSKGEYIQVNLTADTNLNTVDRVQEPRGEPAQRHHREAERHRRRGAGGRGLRHRGPFFRQDRGVHGDLAASQRQFPRRHQAGAGGDGCTPARPARRPQGARRLRRHGLHLQRHPRGAQDPQRHADDRHGRHFPFPRLLPLRSGAGSCHPPVADRRLFSDAGLRVHHKPAHPPGHRPLRRTRGRRRHRGGRKRRAPSARRKIADGCRADRGARTGRADHRHDHHPGDGLPAHRSAGGPDRFALPRVRLHPGRRSRHLRNRGPDPVAGHVGEDPQARRGRARPGRPHHPRLRTVPELLRPPPRRHPGGASGGLRRLDRGLPRWPR